MITYLFNTYFLSFVGFTLYIIGFRKKNIKLKHRRRIVYAVVLLSLVLPLLVSTFKNGTILNIIQSDIEESCVPIPFENNSIFNFIISNSNLLFIGTILIGIVLLTVLLIRISSLIYLVISCPKEQIEIDGENYYIIYPNKNVAVGSFQLRHKYLIWPETMNTMTKSEKTAILWHEIAHLNHKSTWEKIGLEFLQLIWFLNPLVYWLKKELSLVSEYEADEDAISKVGDKVMYAELLLKLNSSQQVAYIQAFQGSSLKKRIARFLQPRIYNQSLGILAIAIITILLTGSASSIQPRIDNYEKSYVLYDKMNSVHQSTGKTDFCTKCLSECLKSEK